MTKIYENANDQHIGAYVVYGKLDAGSSSTGKLYTDEDCTEQLMYSDALEMFKCARILVTTLDSSVPTLCEIISSSGPAFITYSTLPGSTTTINWLAKA